MTRDRADRHRKNARADLCGSAARSIRIFPRRRLVVPETNRANRATQSDPKGFLAGLQFHHERLRALSISDGNGGPQTADVDLVYGKKIIRPSLPSRARSIVSVQPSIPSETGGQGR